jgi:predicted Zn-dependent protease with MMP-like domain
MNKETFEELVAKAVESLPEEFADRLDNVAVTVQDYPNRQQTSRSRLERGMILLGLYEGVPITKRGQSYGMVLPDKITIFQKPIEAICHTEAETVARIRSVVLHEIAHHFGISDERLGEIESGE